jgi:probable HAF family extracellular repeat protein
LATTGILIALVLLSFIPASAQLYTVTDLGTLGGTKSTAAAINGNGQVAGSATVANGSYHAFSWSSDVGMLDLGVLHTGDTKSYAYGINKLGEVVGASYGAPNAFLWTQGEGMTDLGTLGGASAVATGINDSEQVVGYSVRADSKTHAFLWTRTGGMQDLGTLGGTTSVAAAINASGQVVGYSFKSDNFTSHAFLWSESTGMQDLGAMGFQYSSAMGINASGQVVGFVQDAIAYPFVWDSKHGMRELAAIQSAIFTYPFGINDFGRTIGWAFMGNYIGVLWPQPHSAVNVNGLMPHDHGYLYAGYAINNRGQIVGVSMSTPHALLLTPSK